MVTVTRLIVERPAAASFGHEPTWGKRGPQLPFCSRVQDITAILVVCEGSLKVICFASGAREPCVQDTRMVMTTGRDGLFGCAIETAEMAIVKHLRCFFWP